MFLLSPTIFPWDLAILLMLATGLAVGVLCFSHLKRHKRCLLPRLLITIIGYCALIIAGIIAYGSFIEPQIVTVTERTVRFPVSEPLRIVVLSDFHLGPYKGASYMERVVTKVNSLLPDFVLLTGDYVLDDGTKRLLNPKTFAPLKDLRATFGTFAILGNHDHGVHRSLVGMTRGADHGEVIAATHSSLGVNVLQNSATMFNLGTETMAIAGVEDRWSQTKPADLDETFADIPEGMPIILLSHSPDVVLDTLSAKAQLIVAGHTHGGQIRLPLYGPLPILPTRIGRKFDQGLFAIDADTTLAITRGIGESGPRTRLFAPPEILLLRTTQTNSQ